MPNAPTRNTIANVTMRSGRRETYRKPSASRDAPDGAGAGEQLVRPDQQERDDHPEEGDGVEEEDPARADGDDDQARDGGADHPGAVEGCRVQRDRVRRVLAGDDVGDERLSGRVVEGRHDAECEREAVHDHEGHVAGEDHHTERDREQEQQSLGHHEQPAAVEAVGDPAGDADQQQRRRELQRHRHAHRGGVVVGQLGQDDPVLGGRLHPRADVRDERADEPDAVVEDGERAEHGAHRATIRCMIAAACGEDLALAGLDLGQGLFDPRVASTRGLVDDGAAVVGQIDHDFASVVLVGAARRRTRRPAGS